MTTPDQTIDSIRIEWTTLPWPLVLLFCALAIGYSVWYYRHTVPAVGGWRRRLLTGLRIAALLVVVILAAGPVLHTRSTVTRQSVTAVLFDTSASMDVPADPERSESAVAALTTLKEHLGDTGSFQGFDSTVHPLPPDNTAFSGAGTDISMAIESVSGNLDVRDVVLLSDGRWNLGKNPVELELSDNITVHTVTTGSADIPGDIVIDRLSAPSIGREGDSLHVEVTVSSQAPITGSIPVTIAGPDGQRVTGGAQFDRASRGSVVFDIPLNAPGDVTFTAEARPGEEFSDLTTENNRRTFDVHILKRTFTILLVARKPSADLAFLRRVIESDESLSLEVVVSEGLTGAEEKTLPADLGRFDAILILDGGGSAVTEQLVRGKLTSWLAGGHGLWLLGSTPPDIPDAFTGILPVSYSGGALLGGELSIVRTEAGRSHPVASALGETGLSWDNLPPLPSLFRVAGVLPHSQVLAVTAAVPGNESVPALVSGVHGSGKVLVFPASGFWRWKLMLEGTGRNELFYTTFVSNAVRWLAAETDISPLDVSTDKRTYLGGEEIRVAVRPHDAVYTPVPGAEVTLTIDGDPASKTILRESAAAEYTAVLRGITAGEHTIKVTAFGDGITLGERSVPVSVQTFSLEQLDTRPDIPLMAAIAEKTGGTAVTAEDIGSLLPALTPETHTERREDRYPLRNWIVLLVLVIALLTAEWIIRKRLGML